MKCVLCNQRKGKRYCPAKNSMICAQCCGEKRILEIDCPESCPYLQMGRSHEAILESARHRRTSDPMKQKRHERVLAGFQEIVGRLEFLIAEERRATRDLTDRDVAEALDLLLETYRTEQKGILYEQVSSNLRIEALRRQLRDLIESYRNPRAQSGERRLLLGDAIECLAFIRDLVESHIEDRNSSMSFVDFLARFMPRPRKLEDAGPSIIIPGR